ncbi:RHS repeat-associated core domain-containing protein [Bacillus toyonensis]|uniref:RHS repeat domain-containing protein n=1 Tax=Bacillus toyonensis TaxID=155322 RepID=UPI000279BDB9|nr:RHS repeat-associated core domain-containing protein [Bacillus toyonensis]EJR57639.1 RHS repeat-associated core domain-containing protein [Bacillus toyonensis]
MTDQNGQVVASYEYDAWGNVLKSDAKGIAADNPFGYAGYMYDKEIGMYYLIARYYNPEHGVFLSIDPDLGDEDDPVTQNGYTYGDNNPVMMTDPDGKWAWLVPVAIAGARIVGKYGVKYGKKAAKWTANKAKDAWKNRKYTIQGPSKRDGRIFAIVNRKKSRQNPPILDCLHWIIIKLEKIKKGQPERFYICIGTIKRINITLYILKEVR